MKISGKCTPHVHPGSTASFNRSDTFLVAMAALSADQSRPLALAAAAGAGLLYTAQQLIKAITRRRDPALSREAGSSGGNGSLWQPNPNPKWQPPHKQPAPFGSDEMHTVDPAKLPADAMYPLIISAVVPRPIGFVSTQNSEGRGNLAPYSYFNVMAHNPPTVAIGCSASRLRSHGRKDTLVNILETGCVLLVLGQLPVGYLFTPELKLEWGCMRTGGLCVPACTSCLHVAALVAH
jgi:hypothetical protein